MSETKEIEIDGKGVLITLGIACIVLAACLVGAVAAYTLVISDNTNTVACADEGARRS